MYIYITYIIYIYIPTYIYNDDILLPSIIARTPQSFKWEKKPKKKEDINAACKVNQL